MDDERLDVPAFAVAAIEPELVEAALRPLDGAFAAVVAGRGPRAVLRAALDRTGAPAARVAHVGTDHAELRAAIALGMRVARPADVAEAMRPLAAAS